VSKVVEESTERDALTGKGDGRNTAKKVAIYVIKRYAGLGNQEIGTLFGGMHYSAASKPFARLEKAMKDNKALRNLVKGIVSNART
jgi:chromosomal replication initiation ATPase DnaA